MRFFTIAISALTLGTPALSEDAKTVKVLEAIVSGASPDFTADIEFLGGGRLGLYKSEKGYFFIPNPIADWAPFNNSVNELCAKAGSLESFKVPLDILMYEESTITALAEVAGVPKSQISPVPSYAYSVFYRIGNDSPVLLHTTLDAPLLLEAEGLAPNRDLPARKQILVEGDCSKLSNIGNLASILVHFHVLGRESKSARFNAAVYLGSAIDLELEADSRQSQTNTRTVSTATDASGVSVDLGPVSWNSGGGDSTVTTSVNRYRTIDSDWTQRVIRRATTMISISQVCEAGMDCNPEAFEKLLSDFLMNYVQEERATMIQMDDNSHKLSIGGIPTDLTVKANESLSQQLDLLLKTLNETETTVPLDGKEVKARKLDDNTLQFNGGVDWSRDGEDWIPTSFAVSVVNEGELERQVKLQFESIILGNQTRVSAVGGDNDPFVRTGESQVPVGPTWGERIFNLENRSLQCQQFKVERPRGTDPRHFSHATLEAILPDGFVLAGGGCGASDFQYNGARWSFITSSRPTDDGRGWRCVYNPIPNWAVDYVAVATAIGCAVQ